MAIKVNAVTEENAGSNAKLYTGVAAMKVVALNPTKAELEAMGYAPKKEPEYKSEETGLRLDIYLEGLVRSGEFIKTKHSIWLKPTKRTDMYINNFGNFGKDKDKVNSERNPYDGEIELILFLGTLCATAKGEEVCLDKMDDLAKKGDLKELKSIFKAAKDNLIKVLLGVKDFKYQTVYGKKLERGYGRDFSYMHKSLVDNQSYINADFGDIDLSTYRPEDFNLKVYNGASVMASAATPSVGTDAGIGAIDSTDDLPF